jgi:membrane protease YdiL (CAAX protease family)
MTGDQPRASFSLLAGDRTFAQQALPFFVPYALYVGLSGLLPATLGPVWPQAVKLVAVALALVVFRRSYRCGPLRPRHLLTAVVATPAALLLWAGPSYLLRAAGIGGTLEVTAIDSAAYFILRLVNSVVLVAMIEELLLRVYVMEWAYQGGKDRQGRNLLDALLATLDARPGLLTMLPLSLISVVLTTTLFAIGHAPVEYGSAVLYFLFTTWLYARTKSLWVCILVHAQTNLLIAGLVRFGGLPFLWF